MTQFYCHYKLMMLWFIENPKDGQQVARRIKVGIPPDFLQSPDLNAVILGLTVPEADREVRSQPLAISKLNAVPGLPHNENLSVKELFHLSVKDNQTVVEESSRLAFGMDPLA